MELFAFLNQLLNPSNEKLNEIRINLFLVKGGPGSEGSWVSGQIVDLKKALRSKDAVLLNQFVDRLSDRILGKAGTPLHNLLVKHGESMSTTTIAAFLQEARARPAPSRLTELLEFCQGKSADDLLDFYQKKCWHKMAGELVEWLSCHRNPITQAESDVREMFGGRKILTDSLVHLCYQWRNFQLMDKAQDQPTGRDGSDTIEPSDPCHTIFYFSNESDDASTLACFSRAFRSHINTKFECDDGLYDQSALAAFWFFSCRLQAECLKDRLIADDPSNHRVQVRQTTAADFRRREEAARSDDRQEDMSKFKSLRVDADVAVDAAERGSQERIAALLSSDYGSWSKYSKFHFYLISALNGHLQALPVGSLDAQEDSLIAGVKENLTALFRHHPAAKEIFTQSALEDNPDSPWILSASI